MADEPRFAQRINSLVSSPIRDILAVAQQPEIISFAGGLPATELLPAFGGWEAPLSAGQYGPSEGESELREHVCEILRGRGLNVEPTQILITSGSQQGIDLVAKMLLDPGDTVALEAPSYLAAIQVFSLFQAQLFSLGSSVEGLDFEHVETVLSGQPKLSYLVPTFQNPTAYAYTDDERVKMAALLDKTGVPLLEDEPYRELSYDQGLRHLPIAAQLKRAPWIYQGTFSKVLLPGLRIGYIAASPQYIPVLTRLKQAADLHTQRLGQLWISHWLNSGKHAAHVAELVDVYRQKRDLMNSELQQQFSDIASWETPQGGLFYWLKLHASRDTREILQKAIEAGTAFMPGEPFYPSNVGALGRFRLNFSHADPKQMKEGLTRLRSAFEV